jgi:hypothetical protein
MFPHSFASFRTTATLIPVLAILAGCTSTSAPRSSHASTPGSSAPTAPAGPQLHARYVLPDDDGVLAMAAGDGSLWVAFEGGPNPSTIEGKLVRIDPDSGRTIESWVVGNDPLAVTVAGNSVWVANSVGNTPGIDPNANSVSQLSASNGALVHRYHIVVPGGWSPWVITSG